ncbi:MAG: tetratricopeptide repeat protein, partial [Rhodopirellula sp. JB053]
PPSHDRPQTCRRGKTCSEPGSFHDNPRWAPSVVHAEETTDSPKDAAEIIERIDQGDLAAAIAAVTELDVASTTSPKTLAAVIQVARACEKDQRSEEAAEVYHTAAALAKELTSEDSSKIPSAKRAAIWLTAANSLTVVGRDADAFGWLRLAAESTSDTVLTQRVGKSLLSVASGALNANDKLTAGHAYQLAVQQFLSANPGQPNPAIATARLGYAWTLVMAANESGNADHVAQALAAVDEFIEHHPGHADTSSALLLKMSCESSLGRNDAAESTREQLIQNHPRSDAMCQIVSQALGDAASGEKLSGLSESLRQYLVAEYEFVLTAQSLRTNVSVVETALLASAIAGEPNAEAAYAVALSLCDEVGDAATRVLEGLQTHGQEAAAERVAMRWLSARDLNIEKPRSLLGKMQNQSGMLITGAVREAACRWAGRTGQWSMLAMAAAEEPGLYDTLSEPSIEDARRRGRSLHVERLFAEAMLQTGKTKQSLKLWERIVDDHGADDFPTLLRLAETAVSVGSVAQASTRIAAARAAALQTVENGGGHVPSSPEVALTNLLAANLEVRQLNFDRGRALLEQVVRSSRAGSDLRGRAQWMIGETFFMQEKFTEAIAAYRQVEAIGSSDQWTAAALVQAGKSFEQLGRTREATVCYSTLVSRFGDSPHAGGARRRLAAMTSSGSSAPSTIRR